MRSQLSTCLVLASLLIFINNTHCQEAKKHDTTNFKNLLPEAVVSYDITIDTTGLNIVCVLEMERVNTKKKRKETCENSDFIVLYDDFSGVYFEMGCVWDFRKIYWAEKQDSLLFYAGNSGDREHMGTQAFGFDILVKNKDHYYQAYNKSVLIENYIFRLSEQLSSCYADYYSSAVLK